MNVKRMLEEQLGKKIPTEELHQAYRKNLRITSGEEVGINFLNQAVQVYKVILGHPQLQLGLNTKSVTFWKRINLNATPSC